MDQQHPVRLDCRPLRVVWLALVLWATAARAQLLQQDATIVTDLRVVRGDSDAGAREACAAMCPCRASLTSHVTTNWFVVGTNLHTRGDGAFAYLCMRQDRRAAVERDGGSLFALQSIAVVESDRCPTSMTRLFVPREGVVVCLQTTSMAHALATGSYISDLNTTQASNVTSANNQTNSSERDGTGWVSERTSVHMPNGDAPAVYIQYKRPVRPIVGLRMLTGLDLGKSGATACWRLGTSWEQAGTGYILEVESASKRRVLCIQRPYAAADSETTSEDESALRVLTQIEIVSSAVACASDFEESEAISTSWRACFKYDNGSTTTHFLSHVMLTTSAVSNGRPLAEPLSLASYADLNNAKAGLSTYVMIQDAILDNTRRLTTSAVVTNTTNSVLLADKAPLRARVIDANTSDPKLAFKVLQIADLHLTGDPDQYCFSRPSERSACGMQCTENLTTAFLNDLLDAEKPDLVMFSGDTITVREWGLKDAALLAALAPVEARGIPYAWVMGNHDDDYVYDRQEIMDKLVARKLAYVESGPSTIQGVGNYALDIKPPLNVSDDWGGANDTVFRMYCLDSNKNHNATLFPNIKSRYDWIRKEQIAFYDELSERNRQSDANRSVPAVMFFHIPIPEYSSLTSTLFRHGEKHEKTEGPDYNSGLLAALAQRGEVKATFVGHDHTNEYCFKTKGVQLCYGGGTGFGAATYHSSVPRRARVIEWTMDSKQKRRITSWKRLFGRAFGSRTHEEVLFSEY